MSPGSNSSSDSSTGAADDVGPRGEVAVLLVLFRHGPAVDRTDPDCPADADRPLTPDGIVRTRSAAAGLAVLGIRPDRILTSPYVRAEATARIAAKELSFAGSVEIVDALLPGADPRDLLRLAADAEGTLLAAGHEPHLSDVVARGIGGPTISLGLKKAGAAVLELAPGEEPVATLRALYPPRALRQLGGGS
jgi:phosphohistidine phosphatase